MKPQEFPEQTMVFAKDQPEYMPLPAYNDGEQVISCWGMSWRERLQILLTGKVWVRTLTFGRSLQPQLIEAFSPFQPQEAQS